MTVADPSRQNERAALLLRFIHGENMKPTDTDTDIKARRTFRLNIPGTGEIETRMTAAQALHFVADFEQQLNLLVPRSLRTIPISFSEIDAIESLNEAIDELHEALQAARYALRRALNDSATSVTLSDALKRVESVLDRPTVQS